MLEEKRGIDENKLQFTSDTDLMVSVFRNHDPDNLTSDDYSHLSRLLKKFWDVKKDSWKLRKAHRSYWELVKKSRSRESLGEII